MSDLQISVTDDIEVIDVDETEEIIDFTYAITSDGADYPVDSLVKRLKEETILVPGFQRQYVWTLSQASRFIESLLLGLPVPGIFLSRESESQKMLVVDGQQRLKTLQFFYDGLFEGKEFRLEGVQKQFEGKTYKTISDESRRRLDDSIIHATIIRQDEPSEDESSVYHIFERLNTGGTLLKPQEIRACIFHGPFNELLRELCQYPPWKKIFGKPGKRLKDQEFALRFFALRLYRDHYIKPLKEFLNLYMGKNRILGLHSEDFLRSKFITTVDFVADVLGEKAFRPITAINASIYDSAMVAISERLEAGPIIDREGFLQSYNKLLQDSDYTLATSRGTSDDVTVKRRIHIAKEYLGSNLK